MAVEGRAEGNVTVARRWFEELWSWPALDGADEIVDAGYAPDWIQIPRTGPEQVKHEIRYFRSAFPDVAYEVVDTAAQGDRVWVRYRARGTQLGEAWGFRPRARRPSLKR